MELRLKMMGQLLGITMMMMITFGDPVTSQNPPNNLKALFQAPKGQPINYPPPDTRGPTPRDLWVQAYQKAKSAGLIPAIPVSTVQNFNPVYPQFQGKICNPKLPNACYDSLDIKSAPGGVAGISFDDGPVPPSMDLLGFLRSQTQRATHFLIGSQILKNENIFKAMDDAKEELAVHTWSHPMSTSLSDMEILGELGWTMQIIFDKSQSHVIPRLWRPPYGDIDQRVQAIAKNVFGLVSVFWNFDSQDYCLSDTNPQGSDCPVGSGPQNIGDLKGSLDKFINTNKQSGLIILEHEKNNRAVAAFKYIFPRMKQAGWSPKTIAEISRGSPYQ